MKEEIKQRILTTLKATKFPEDATETECDELLAERLAVRLDQFFRITRREDNSSSDKGLISAGGFKLSQPLVADSEVICKQS